MKEQSGVLDAWLSRSLAWSFHSDRRRTGSTCLFCPEKLRRKRTARPSVSFRATLISEYLVIVDSEGLLVLDIGLEDKFSMRKCQPEFCVT